MRTRPWNTSEAEVILTSREDFKDERTPVVTRSERPNLSICSVSLFTSSIFFADVAGWSSLGRGLPSPSSRGGVSSPFTDEAPDWFADPAFAREAAVFLGFPSAALLASRAAFDAETMMSERQIC